MCCSSRYQLTADVLQQQVTPVLTRAASADTGIPLMREPSAAAHQNALDPLRLGFGNAYKCATPALFLFQLVAPPLLMHLQRPHQRMARKVGLCIMQRHAGPVFGCTLRCKRQVGTAHAVFAIPGYHSPEALLHRPRSKTFQPLQPLHHNNRHATNKNNPAG